MPLAVENAFCDASAVATMETPGKKRKRNAETNPFLNFSEQTFNIPSSTPIHNRQIDGSAFENASFRVGNNNKENYNLFSDSCMEVKSIADLAAKRTPGAVCDPTNPFEVVRKPPKKKKKQQHSLVADALQDSCFENPALNLAAVDKQPVNPFEVPRDGDESKRREAEELSRCFVNNALNIRGPEANSGERFNPFEIVRPKEPAPEPPVRGLPLPELAGIENPALEMPTYAIAVPFTPSLKHRINFQELAANALTPCQMMANMVVCSPDGSVPTQAATTSSAGSGDTPQRNATVTLAKKCSLSVISEESDIGEKLDCYQLELENSINEAKARKQRQGETTPFSFSGTGHRRRSVRRSLIDMKHISNLSQKLRDLEDEENGITKLEDADTERHGQENEDEEEDKENRQPSPEKEVAAIVPEDEKKDKTESKGAMEETAQQTEAHRNQMTFTITKETTVREEIRIDVSNPDVQFEEVEDFEDEEQDVELLHNPAPFQRAYRKKEPLATRPSAEEFKCPAAVAPGEPRENGHGKSHKVRDVIRRSFRRLIPRHHSDQEPQEKGKDVEEKHPSDEGNQGHGHGLISSIRHSLRRRQTTKAAADAKDNKATEDSPLEISIIAEQPRAVFRQPSLDQYKPITAAPAGGGTLRGSLRRSTKDIRKQMMKSVFRKQSGDLGAELGEHGGQLI
uniref:Uncharacterized protein n=1 Tax=Anopheles atroparvus TaxID=41427 RepID=A0AAG5CYE5_ANOAO